MEQHFITINGESHRIMAHDSLDSLLKAIVVKKKIFNLATSEDHYLLQITDISNIEHCMSGKLYFKGVGFSEKKETKVSVEGWFPDN